MKKDIPEHISQGVYLAIVPTEDSTIWEAYLVNDRDVTIDNILINSKGFGEVDKQEVSTSVLRHHILELKPKSFTKIENVTPEVFGLNNRFWVTYYIGRIIYDKKFLFTPYSIDKQHFTNIPVLGKKGVLHR